MGFFDRFKKINYEERAEIMKYSCTSFVVDIIEKVLPMTELSNHEIFYDDLEPLIFGMFIINNLFYSIKGDSEMTRNQLKRFHLIMDNFIFNDIILKKSTVKSDEIDGYYERLSNLINKRYAEYGRLLQLDLHQGSFLFRKYYHGLCQSFILRGD